MPDRWARCAGFPAYEISTTGSVRQRHTGRVLGCAPSDTGYPTVHLQRAGRWYTRTTHTLVWRTFRGDPGGREVDHRDRNRGNPRLSNLRLATRSQQMAYAACTRGRSRYRGVSWQKSRGAWFSCIMVQRQNRFLGRFKTERGAALAYDIAARRAFGRFAVTNFGRCP